MVSELRYKRAYTTQRKVLACAGFEIIILQSIPAEIALTRLHLRAPGCLYHTVESGENCYSARKIAEKRAADYTPGCDQNYEGKGRGNLRLPAA